MTRTTIIAVLLSVVIVFTISFQLLHAWRFMSAGPRFTAADGQALCQRIQQLERRTGSPVEPCAFPTAK